MQRAAKVASFVPLPGWKLSIALISPIVPIEIRSSRSSPVLSNFFDDVGHQAQIVFDQQVSGMLIPFCHQLEMLRFFFLLQRLREGVVLDVGNQQRELFDEQSDGSEQSRHE